MNASLDNVLISDLGMAAAMGRRSSVGIIIIVLVLLSAIAFFYVVFLALPKKNATSGWFKRGSKARIVTNVVLGVMAVGVLVMLGFVPMLKARSAVRSWQATQWEIDAVEQKFGLSRQAALEKVWDARLKLNVAHQTGQSAGANIGSSILLGSLLGGFR
jgi:hypothetical protein